MGVMISMEQIRQRAGSQEDTMTDYERRVFERAIEHFGNEAQQKMLVEEMSELTKEVCKIWRGRANLDHLAEEMADVQICLEQLKMMLQNGGLVQKWMLEKTRRLEEMIQNDILASSYAKAPLPAKPRRKEPEK